MGRAFSFAICSDCHELTQRLSAQETQVLLLLGNGKTRAEIAKELSAVTFLKAAGVSNALAMEIIGHESAAISRGYTHVSADDLRREMAKLPDVTKG